MMTNGQAGKPMFKLYSATPDKSLLASTKTAYLAAKLVTNAGYPLVVKHNGRVVWSAKEYFSSVPDIEVELRLIERSQKNAMEAYAKVHGPR
jgi:hypothetical protein